MVVFGKSKHHIWRSFSQKFRINHKKAKLLLIKGAPMKKVTKPTKTHNLQDAAAKKRFSKLNRKTCKIPSPKNGFQNSIANSNAD
jgi:hypothetical protein